MRISRNHLCLVVHFCTRMKNKVMDCTKSQQIIIRMCRHSFMCGYDRCHTASSWSNTQNLWDGELECGQEPEGSITSYNSTAQTEKTGELSVQACHTGGIRLPPWGHITEHWSHSAGGSTAWLFSSKDKTKHWSCWLLFCITSINKNHYRKYLSMSLPRQPVLCVIFR